MNEEYQQRRKRHNPDRRVGRVTRLDGCGLYRRAAIESIGYLTDRNLHAAEELDLGARLHSASWTLIKLDRRMVHHEPHRGRRLSSVASPCFQQTRLRRRRTNQSRDLKAAFLVHPAAQSPVAGVPARDRLVDRAALDTVAFCPARYPCLPPA